MGKITLKLLCLAAAAALAAPALAAPAAPPAATPPMADGDMGCFIALGLVAIDADKAGKSDKLEQKDRDLMTKLATTMRNDARWFFGRVTALPATQRSKAAFEATFGRVNKTEKKQIFTDAMACSDWASATNTVALDTWAGK